MSADFILEKKMYRVDPDKDRAHTISGPHSWKFVIWVFLKNQARVIISAYPLSVFQPKHANAVGTCTQRMVSTRRFFWAPRANAKMMDKKIFTILFLI